MSPVAGDALRVIVTGAGGMLAHDLAPALRAAGHVVTLMDRGDLDVTDPSECLAGVEGHDLVVNCAAWTVDLADLNVLLVAAPASYGVHHGTASGRTTWRGLAQAVFEERGLDPERVQPTTSQALGLPAPRPSWSVLSHDSLERAGVTPIGDWRASLTTYLAGGAPA